MPKSRSQTLFIDSDSHGLGTKLSYAQMSKWLNNISRDLQNLSRGRGTSKTKLRMRMLRSLKSTIALVRKDFM